jgi:hypothetical protein
MERIILLTASLALWLVLGQNMFFLVALGAGYQIVFAGHLPSHPSRSTTIYYLAVLTALGLIIRLMPGTGLGTVAASPEIVASLFDARCSGF